MSELKNQVESLLFSAGKRLTLEELGRLCKEENLDAIKVVLELLKKELDEKDSPLMLVQEGDAYKLTVREKYIPVVKKVVTTPELPKSILETLAVVAYKAPVLQSQVIKIRTNKAYRHLDELEELGYLTREKKGRSKLIKLTPKFFDYFDVPPEKLKEKFRNVAALEQAIEEKEKAAQQSQHAIVAAAQETTPTVEIVAEDLPKLAPEIEVIGGKVGELETYGEAPKPKKRHKKKPAAAEEAPKTVEEAAEALAERLLGEAGMAAPAGEAMEEEGRLTLERIKAEAAKAKPKRTEYTPKGIFAGGMPAEVQERVEHRVAEILEGKERPHEEGEEEPSAEIPEIITSPPEEPEEGPAEEPETPAEEAEETPEEHAAHLEEHPAEEGEEELLQHEEDREGHEHEAKRPHKRKR
jgi:segregation and condensation protein B